MIRNVSVVIALCACLACAVTLAQATSTNRVIASEAVLLPTRTLDFDATVTIRQTRTDDYKKWAQENKFPLSDSTNYDQARFARLGEYHFAEVSTFNKEGKLLSLFRASWQLHTDPKTGVKSGVCTQYMKNPETESSGLGLIQSLNGDFELIGPVEMARQALYRHVLYDELNGVTVVLVDSGTNDVLEVWRGGDIAGETPMKAIFTDYQTLDSRRIAKHLAFQMRTPGTGTLAKTIDTELTDFKSKPETTTFLDTIPAGTPVYDSIRDISYIQPKPGEAIDISNTDQPAEEP